MKDIPHLFFWRKQEYIRQELLSILDKGQKSELLDEASRIMMENIIDFTKIMVREIMIPRTEVVAVSADDSSQEILQEIINSHFTRIPVYRGSIDNIIGILNVKDLLKYWSKPMTIADIMASLTKPYYIPETKNAHLLFSELKNNKKHMAVVIDEYGGTSGLVTLEDLLEEIVGDIRDEHDESADSEEIVQTVEGTVVVDARTEIEKIEEHFNINLDRGRYETLGGLILNTIRRIPHNGETFQIYGMDITIESADERSIKKVKIRKTDDGKLNEE
jgi:CBS domain containing-hemolysin-like protein